MGQVVLSADDDGDDIGDVYVLGEEPNVLVVSPKNEIDDDIIDLFVQHYAYSFNGRMAYKAVNPLVSDGEASLMARRILSTPGVKLRIRQRFSEHVMSPEEAMARLGAMARADVSDFLIIDEGGTLVPDLKTALSLGLGHLIHSVTKTTREVGFMRETVWSFKLHDSQKALMTVLKAAGLLDDVSSQAFSKQVDALFALVKQRDVDVYERLVAILAAEGISGTSQNREVEVTA